MKNNAESMPNPAQEPKSPLIQDEDIESLMKAFQEADKKEDPEEVLKAAVAEIDETFEKVLRLAEFEKNFEGIKDQDWFAAEKQTEEIFSKIQMGEGVAAEETKAEAPKFQMDVARLGEAKLKNGLTEMLRARVIDVVIENYRHDVAQAELFDKPFAAAMESAGIPASGDAEQIAHALHLETTTGYASMKPEAQAALRNAIKPMVTGVVESLRELWNKEVLEAVQRKVALLEDNKQQLEEAKASLADKPKALGEHEKSIEKNDRMIENAKSILSGFSHE